MAASKPVEAAGGGGGTGLSRWQLALVLGAPILLGAGALYLWGRRAARRGGKGASERKTPEGRASPGPCGGGGQLDGPGHEETVSARLRPLARTFALRPVRARVAAVRPRRCGSGGRGEAPLLPAGTGLDSADPPGRGVLEPELVGWGGGCSGVGGAAWSEIPGLWEAGPRRPLSRSKKHLPERPGPGLERGV